MLQQQDLVSHFSGVVDLGDNVFKCKDVLPNATFHYYVKLREPGSHADELLIVSENKTDDDFAFSVLASVPSRTMTEDLVIHAIPKNRYGLLSAVLAPARYHGYFKGRLDDKRERLVLCMPIHRCEFSGSESVEDFFLMRRKIVPTLNWEREVHPKSEMRFDNPVTHGGTGDAFVCVKSDTVLREIENLRGVANGFIEIRNYKGQISEILSAYDSKFYLIRERKDQDRELMNQAILREKIWSFLTTG